MSGVSDPSQNVASAPERSEPEPYRPLSLLALLGFIVGVLYALFIIAGGILALFQRSPWLLPAWLFLIPLVAVILSLIARNRIRDSEGTLGGTALTRWGISLSLVFGVLYGAYFAATYIAVRQQAGSAAEAFLENIRSGNVDRAFVLGLPPASRPSVDSGLREKLEVEYNAPNRSEGGGRYSNFKRADWVRFLEEGGEQAQIRPVGVHSWNYDRGGYRVVLMYHVQTPLFQYDVHVSVFGVEVRSGQLKGRQWQVMLADTGMSLEAPHMTPEGEALIRLGQTARNFVNGWERDMEAGQWVEVYLGTQPPSERQRLRRAHDLARLGDAVAVLGPTPAALQDDSVQQLRRGFEAFSRGSLIDAEDRAFWAPPKQRDPILKRMKEIFDPAKPWLQRFHPQPTRVPTWHRADGQLFYAFSYNIITVNPEVQRPEYVAEGEVVVAIPEDQMSAPSPPWRVTQLKLVTARSAPRDEQRQSRTAPNLPPPPQ